MFSDIVFPKDNEKKLINMAIRLGYSNLYLIYDSKENFDNETLEKLKDKPIKIITEAQNKNQLFSTFEIRNLCIR